MQIETYEINELTEDGKIENLEETKKLVEELGLKGQERFFNPDASQVSVFSYRKMSKQESLVYKTLLTQACKLADYKDSVIPIRVLQVAAHAISTGFLHTLEVWHPENADVKDPVLVGKVWKDKTHVDSSYYDHEIFILARWGEVLESFESLKNNAFKILLNDAKTKLLNVVSEANLALTNIEQTLRTRLEKGEAPYVSFSCH